MSIDSETDTHTLYTQGISQCMELERAWTRWNQNVHGQNGIGMCMDEMELEFTHTLGMYMLPT